MQELATHPGQVLMIGDTTHDLQMAASAGVDAVAVCYGAHAAADLQRLAPRACVSSVGELGQWLTTHA
jgi:phosphoglycolate phosphatase